MSERSMIPTVQQFWSTFLAQSHDPEEKQARFHEAYKIGDTEKSADEGARLILSGIKTATSSLLWEYESEGTKLPAVGDLNIVMNGRNEPACVVETTWLAVQAFSKVDARYARDYGEWDGTLATWREQTWKYYSALSSTMNRSPSEEMLLVCERFEVIYAPDV